jgi:DNA-3-methyladenine glycosylase II
MDVIDPTGLAGTDGVAVALREAGPVARLRNPDLWDALSTSIMRQVIRASQARKLYRTFSQEHGEPVITTAGTVHLFPSPDAVLGLPDEEFARLGLAFKRQPLRAAAESYLELGPKWLTLDPPQLLTEIQSVPRIGPWTAGATVADITNNYRLYPFADLAVRTWAKHLVTGRRWPDTEPEFAHLWQRLAADQLSDWTLLTLAWGVRYAGTTGKVAL